MIYLLTYKNKHFFYDKIGIGTIMCTKSIHNITDAFFISHIVSHTPELKLTETGFTIPLAYSHFILIPDDKYIIEDNLNDILLEKILHIVLDSI